MLYRATVAARTPQAAAPPTLVEVGPVLDARGLSWSSELVGAGAAEFTTDPSSLPEDIRTRLRSLTEYPCELWLDRDGTRVFAGPIIGLRPGEDGDLTVTAAGLLYYLRYMLVASDLTFAAVEQFTIARTLVSQWQALAYGNYGIDTSAATTSGVTRDRTYLGTVEEHPVLLRLEQLAAVIDGFDFWIDPQTRALELATSRGADLSASVILDRRGVTNPSAFHSVAAGDIASEAVGRSYDPDADTVLTSAAANTTLRSTFGRCAVSGTFDGVVEQATLDGHTAALLTYRGVPFFTAQPQLVPVAGAGVEDFDVGDLVTWDFDDGLGRRTEVRRVNRRRVTVSDVGQEVLDVDFA